MRFFISQNGSTTVEKKAFNGDNTLIDGIVAQYKANHPLLTVTEVDQPTFDAAVVIPPQTQAQTAWATLKASSPTALQAITFLAKFLGLE